MTTNKPRIFLVSGPCGCGKSTLTKALTQELACRSTANQAFLVEGDLFHQGFYEGPRHVPGENNKNCGNNENNSQWDPLAPNAFAGKHLSWPEILEFNWSCIISTADKILQRGLDVVIDYVVEDELPLVQQLAEKYQVPLYYIVLTASEDTLRERITERGDVEMIDRSLFLRNKLFQMPENQGHLFDNTGMTVEEEINHLLLQIKNYLV